LGLADHFKDEKALHSRVGRSRKSDYVVTFADAQDLERIRKKLLKASLLLKSNAKVGDSWNSKMRELSAMLGIEELRLADLMHQYACTHEQHTLVVDSLCDRLSGTRKLVGGAGSIPVQAWTDCSSKILQILSFRNTELAISTNIGIRGNGKLGVSNCAHGTDCQREWVHETNNDRDAWRLKIHQGPDPYCRAVYAGVTSSSEYILYPPPR
jgi:hypothetical protein